MSLPPDDQMIMDRRRRAAPATAMISSVILTSADEGVGSPEGWLWTSTIAVAESSSARRTTSRGIDRRVIDGAGALHFVGDQAVALVEEQDAKFLAVGKGHRGAAIIDDLAPRAERQPLLRDALGEALGAASRILNSLIEAALMPSISASRSGRAAIASANEPKRAISALASGLTSRRGIARNSTSSSNS